MAIFTRQFSTMIDAGLPLVQCLNILAEQSEAKNLRDVTANIARNVEQGSTLAEALRKHPRHVRRPLHQHGGGRRDGRYPGRRSCSGSPPTSRRPPR